MSACTKVVIDPVNGWVWIAVSQETKRIFITDIGELQAYHFGKSDLEVDAGLGNKASLSVHLTRFMPFDNSITPGAKRISFDFDIRSILIV